MNTPIVADKYRGSVAYFRVLAEIVKTAEQRTLVTYQTVAGIMGLPPTGNHMGKEIGHLLDEINEDEHRRGRPMLSAVVVNTEGVPGAGFQTLAKTFGKLAPDANAKEFWRRELAAVYGVWSGADAEGA